MKAVKNISISNIPYNICDIDLRNTLGGAAQEIQWNAELNINTITRAGIYRIKGERLNNSIDNIPIDNADSGHTIDASLQVLNSSLTNGSGKETDICVTQILTLSNRVGGDGDIYIRTGRGINEYSIAWETWGKLQTNIELGLIDDNELNNYIDNGIYSGATHNGDTFVMIVINNYAIAGLAKYTRHISQLMYSVNLEGAVHFRYRVGEGDETISWGEWKRTLSDSISYTINNYTSFAEAKIDTDGLCLSIGSYNTTYRTVTINPGDQTSNEIVTFTKGQYTSTIGVGVAIQEDVVIGTSTNIGKEVIIGEKVNIGEEVTIPQGLTISTILLTGNVQGLKFTYNGKSTTFQLT